MSICKSNVSVFERRSLDVCIKWTKTWDCMRRLQVFCLPLCTHTCAPIHSGHPEVLQHVLIKLIVRITLGMLVEALHLHLLVFVSLCYKVPPETFRCLQWLIDSVAFSVSCFSILPDPDLGVMEFLNVLVNSLRIMLAFQGSGQPAHS